MAGWKNLQQIDDLSKLVKPISYRPFDNRYIFYEDKLVWRTVKKVMHHMLAGENVGLIFRRQQPSQNPTYYFITNKIISDGIIRSDNKGGESLAPLYLYPENETSAIHRTPNLDTHIVEQIADNLGLAFTSEKSDVPNTFAPIDLLDYIYAVLHSPSYRQKFQEFLKTDFPRVPYPTDVETFWRLAELGKRLRTIHLMDSPELSPLITRYPVEGDNTVTRKIVKKDYELTDKERGLGRVWINDTQYFDGVPQKAWEFYIGGYQPAQKWLKDRHGRTLRFEEILHYQKIVKALTLTDAIMQEIDSVSFMTGN